MRDGTSSIKEKFAQPLQAVAVEMETNAEVRVKETQQMEKLYKVCVRRLLPHQQV